MLNLLTAVVILSMAANQLSARTMHEVAGHRTRYWRICLLGDKGGRKSCSMLTSRAPGQNPVPHGDFVAFDGAPSAWSRDRMD